MGCCGASGLKDRADFVACQRGRWRLQLPGIWKPNGTREETGQVIKATARPLGLVEEVERRDPQLYRNLNNDEGDDMRTRFAEYVITEKKPEVTLLHLFDLDHFEHDYGPFTPEAFAMLEKVDGYVARIIAATDCARALRRNGHLHRQRSWFLPVSKRIHPGVILARKGLLRVREEKDAQGRSRTSSLTGEPPLHLRRLMRHRSA